MTLRVVFIDDPAEAYENGLASGRFDRDAGSPQFFARYEYLASDAENGQIVADHFRNVSNTYITIERKEIAR